MFPVINNIDDVLPHIQGNDNFAVNHKDDYIVIDYILNTPDTFHNEYEKECRGIIFHADGRIMARRLHKFFNLNERPESSIDNLDFSKKHWILEKLDGSMITPIYVNGRLTWGSKAGETFLTPQIEAFVKDHPNYSNFAVFMDDDNFTSIFEWCSRKNRIVLDYPEDRLVLLAVRNNVTGEYLPYEYLVEAAEGFNVEVVKEYAGTIENMKLLGETVKDMTGIEGFVVRFEDGHMVKVKCAEYVLHHKAKDDINLEKNVVAILAEEKADDFRSLLSADDRRRFEAFEKDFWINVNMKADIFEIQSYTIRKLNISRKDYALHYPAHDSFLRSYIFKHFEDSVQPEWLDGWHYILDLIKKNCGSQTNVNKVRQLFGNINWVDYN